VSHDRGTRWRHTKYVLFDSKGARNAETSQDKSNRAKIKEMHVVCLMQVCIFSLTSTQRKIIQEAGWLGQNVQESTRPNFVGCESESDKEWRVTSSKKVKIVCR